MATTHIVSNHLGGSYLSQKDPDFIMKFCPTCGDCDWIVASFEDRDEDGTLQALHDAYFELRFLPTKSDVEEYEKEHRFDELEEMLEDVQDSLCEKNMRSFCDALNKGCPHPIPATTVDKFVSLGSQYLSEFDFLSKAIEE